MSADATVRGLVAGMRRAVRADHWLREAGKSSRKADDRTVPTETRCAARVLVESALWRCRAYRALLQGDTAAARRCAAESRRWRREFLTMTEMFGC